MGCDAAASALTVLFSFPFSHRHSLTVLQLSRIHFLFSLLLSLKWCCLLAIFWQHHFYFLSMGVVLPPFFTSPLTLAAVQNSLFTLLLCFLYNAVVLSTFFTSLLIHYDAVVQNSLAIFTFAFS